MCALCDDLGTQLHESNRMRKRRVLVIHLRGNGGRYQKYSRRTSTTLVYSIAHTRNYNLRANQIIWFPGTWASLHAQTVRVKWRDIKVEGHQRTQTLS